MSLRSHWPVRHLLGNRVPRWPRAQHRRGQHRRKGRRSRSDPEDWRASGTSATSVLTTSMAARRPTSIGAGRRPTRPAWKWTRAD